MSSNPVPPPEQGEPPEWSKDSLARKEIKYWPDEERLSNQRNKNQLRWLKLYGFLVVVLTCLFTSMFVFGLVAWTWHYVTPASWAWLTENQLSKIQSVIFSGSLGAIVSAIVQRQLAK